MVVAADHEWGRAGLATVMPLAAPHILVTDVADTALRDPLPAPFSFLDAVASLSGHLRTVTTLRLR